MPSARDIHGTVFKNGSAILLARVVDASGSAVQQADLSAIEYTVYELDPCRVDSQTAVTGHDGVAVTVADIIYDTLQTGAEWTVDATGYNFRHEVPVSTNDAFPTAGRSYQIRYELTPTSGEKIIVRFVVKAI